MEIKHFGIFLHINYPMIVVTEEESNKIGEAFKEYLLDKFKDDVSKLDDIWDIDPMKAIIQKNHPFKMNGYHPALLIHFGDFLRIESEK